MPLSYYPVREGWQFFWQSVPLNRGLINKTYIDAPEVSAYSYRFFIVLQAV
jgi:hypothetical protein